MNEPVLALSGVTCPELFGRHARDNAEFLVQSGELVLVDARDATLASGFADLCCGLLHPDQGTVRFLGHDWSSQPREMADALRGLIGRVLADPGWLPFLDAETNILLPQLHHTRLTQDVLLAQAAGLADEFGLPGLPAGSIARLAPEDLTRAGFVRAFLGRPKLVVLESPVQGLFGDMVSPLLRRIAEVHDRGGAAIWLTRSRLVWDDRTFPASQRIRLSHQGLIVVGSRR
jgi:phospholipid/cholesterol/gamma-HCH transport system ATP-binding protein